MRHTCYIPPSIHWQDWVRTDTNSNPVVSIYAQDSDGIVPGQPLLLPSLVRSNHDSVFLSLFFFIFFLFLLFRLYHIVLMLFLCPPFSAFVIPHSVGLILQDYLLSAPVLIMCFMSYHGHVMSFLYSLVRFLVRLGRGVICIAYTQAMTVADRPSLGGWAGAALVAGYLPLTYTHP